MSASASRIIRKPARTSAWSSTIRTRTHGPRRRCRELVLAVGEVRRGLAGRGAQRRELAVQALDRQLVDAHRPIEVLELLRSEVEQLEPSRSCSSSSSSDRVVSESRICPPWPASQIRAARWTASPTYWSPAARRLARVHADPDAHARRPPATSGAPARAAPPPPRRRRAGAGGRRRRTSRPRVELPPAVGLPARPRSSRSVVLKHGAVVVAAAAQRARSSPRCR